MIKRILFLGVISFGVAQEVSLEKEKALEQPKNYLSRGLFDHKTGITFIGYSRTLLNIKQHELFIGLGTGFIANIFSVGVKFKLIDRPFIFDKAYGVVSLYRAAGMGKNILTLPSGSLGFQKNFSNNSILNIGFNITIRTYSDDRPTDFLGFPHVSLSKRW